MGTSIQSPYDFDESGTARGASSVAGWCFALAALLVAALCLAGCGKGGEADASTGLKRYPVPGGWLYATRVYGGEVTTFVPDPSAPNVAKKGG